MDFFNWYKKRINRIFPTIFAVAIMEIAFWGWDPTLKHVILKGGGWFVQAIFIFYAIFWFVKRFLENKLWIAFSIISTVILIWFFGFWDKNVFILADATYLRWPAFFLVMLLGAAVSNIKSTINEDRKGWFYFGLLLILLVSYYGYQLLWNRFPILKNVQIILLPCLMGIIYTFYRLFSNEKVLNFYNCKYLNWAFYGISACCLEIYLSGSKCFDVGRSLIHLFPLNIIITFIIVFVLAYFVKVFSNFLSQTFKTERYDWNKMIKL